MENYEKTSIYDGSGTIAGNTTMDYTSTECIHSFVKIKSLDLKIKIIWWTIRRRVTYTTCEKCNHSDMTITLIYD